MFNKDISFLSPICPYMISLIVLKRKTKNKTKQNKKTKNKKQKKKKKQKELKCFYMIVSVFPKEM